MVFSGIMDAHSEMRMELRFLKPTDLAFCEYSTEALLRD
jgi:hypothetical protein